MVKTGQRPRNAAAVAAVNENPPDGDPIIEGLLKRLPKSGDVWPEAERKLWLHLLEGSFKLMSLERKACLHET
jgi:hypothetical protein